MMTDSEDSCVFTHENTNTATDVLLSRQNGYKKDNDNKNNKNNSDNDDNEDQLENNNVDNDNGANVCEKMLGEVSCEKYDLNGNGSCSTFDSRKSIEKLKGNRPISKGPPWYRSQRYILAYFLFGGMMNAFFQRVNLSIAMVCMVNHTATTNTILDTSSTTDYSNTIVNNFFMAKNISIQQQQILHQLLLRENFKSFKNLHQHPENQNITLELLSHLLREQKQTPPQHNQYQQQDMHRQQQQLLVQLNTIRNINSSAFADFQKDKKWLPSNENTSSQIWNNEIAHDVLNMTSFFEDYLLWRSNTSRETDLNPMGSSTSCADFTPNELDAEDGPLVWDKKTQGLVLGAIFWLYMFSAIPFVTVVKNYSRKRIISVLMGIMCACALLLHKAALWSPWAVFALKLAQGLVMAPALMSMYGMWAKWGPPQERTGLVSFCFSGSMMANALTFPLSALLCKYGFLGGWPSVFYVFGLVGLVWVILFTFMTSESPASHRWITEEEKTYIQDSLSMQTQHTPPTPWRSVLTSPAVWGIIFVQFSFTWGLLLVSATLPQYMKEVLKFDIRANGLYCMLPFVAMFVLTSVAGQTTNYVIKLNVIRVVWIRKLNASIANIIPAVLIIILSFLDCSHSGLAVVLLTAAVGITGVHFSSFLLNPYDIAPMHAQAIFTISNSVATIPGIVAPYVVAQLTQDKTQEQWQTVFFLTAGVWLIGTMAFCILGKGEVQPWAESRRKSILIGPSDTTVAMETETASWDNAEKQV